MALLNDLREHLRRYDPGRAAFEPNLALHRKHVIDRLERLEELGRSEEELEKNQRRWRPEDVAEYARAVGEEFIADFAHDASHNEIARLINIALDRELGLVTSSGSAVRDREIDRVRDMFWSYQVGTVPDEHATIAYAVAIRAVRVTGRRRSTTPIGRLVLELPDNDTLRWLLAAEVVQSDGLSDMWRISREHMRYLLAASLPIKERAVPREIGHHFPRLSNMGLLEIEKHHDEEPAYAFSRRGRSYFEELVSDRETPFTMLVQAMLQDETSVALNTLGDIAGLPRAETSTNAVARHARMVAHEIRNALVPVHSAVESLYQDLALLGVRDPVEKRQGSIEAALERVFRFLRDISKIADLAATPSDLFDITSAVQDAIAAFASGTGFFVPFENVAPLPPVKGHRDRFVLALVNLLRNAHQARPSDGLRIHVSAGTHNGAEVFVAVDDNGPGVPVEHRTSIFEPGFSSRATGTGQGLALVREVIEVEMAGRTICEQSDLGGARMVLRLPVGSKRDRS